MPASSRFPAVITDASTLSPIATTAVVEIGRVELLDGEHVGHVGLNGGNLRGPPVDQFGILVDGEHVPAPWNPTWSPLNCRIVPVPRPVRFWCLSYVPYVLRWKMRCMPSVRRSRLGPCGTASADDDVLLRVADRFGCHRTADGIRDGHGAEPADDHRGRENELRRRIAGADHAH